MAGVGCKQEGHYALVRIVDEAEVLARPQKRVRQVSPLSTPICALPKDSLVLLSSPPEGRAALPDYATIFKRLEKLERLEGLDERVMKVEAENKQLAKDNKRLTSELERVSAVASTARRGFFSVNARELQIELADLHIWLASVKIGNVRVGNRTLTYPDALMFLLDIKHPEQVHGKKLQMIEEIAKHREHPKNDWAHAVLAKETTLNLRQEPLNRFTLRKFLILHSNSEERNKLAHPFMGDGLSREERRKAARRVVQRLESGEYDTSELPSMNELKSAAIWAATQYLKDNPI